MVTNTTATLDLNNFRTSLDQVRNSINLARTEALEAGVNIDEFIVPVAMNDGLRISLVLNNRPANNYSANLYISRVLDNDNTVIYTHTAWNEGYISYGSTLPTVDFSAHNSGNYYILQPQLLGNYEHSIRPAVIRLAMLVEAIRSNQVGDVLADALELSISSGEAVHVNFNLFSDVIRNWSHSGAEYVERVEQTRDYLSYKVHAKYNETYAYQTFYDSDLDSVISGGEEDWDYGDDLTAITTGIGEEEESNDDTDLKSNGNSTVENNAIPKTTITRNISGETSDKSDEDEDSNEEELALAMAISLSSNVTDMRTETGADIENSDSRGDGRPEEDSAAADPRNESVAADPHSIALSIRSIRLSLASGANGTAHADEASSSTSIRLAAGSDYGSDDSYDTTYLEESDEMSLFGIGDKPVNFSEIYFPSEPEAGYPTHDTAVLPTRAFVALVGIVASYSMHQSHLSE